MPKDVTSPFTPGQPVPVEFFVGRLAEIEQLQQKIRRSTTGRLETAFLTGERGIGKSSLASFVRHISERREKVLGLHIFLGGVETLEDMVRRIFDALLKESEDASWFEEIRSFFGKYIRQVGLFGVSVEFEAPAQDLRRMAHDFAPALRNLMQRLRDEKMSILLALDDVNGLASSTVFANWLKSLVDEVATSEKPLPLCLLLIGLEERRQSLVNLQPSLARVFDVVDIRAWTLEESQEFFQKTFARVGMSVDEDALEFMANHTGGLPMLAQEIGDAAFNLDDDGRIDQRDALAAVLTAAEIVGRKYLQPQVFQAIRSERYRSILQTIAKQPFEDHFRRRDVLGMLNPDEKRVFDNFLQRMKKLGVITQDNESPRGDYRFSNRLHSIYFWLEAERAKRHGR